MHYIMELCLQLFCLALDILQQLSAGDETRPSYYCNLKRVSLIVNVDFFVTVQLISDTTGSTEAIDEMT